MTLVTCSDINYKVVYQLLIIHIYNIYVIYICITEEIYSFFLTPSDIFTGRNILGNPFHQVLGQKILLNLTCLIARLSNSRKGLCLIVIWKYINVVTT